MQSAVLFPVGRPFSAAASSASQASFSGSVESPLGHFPLLSRPMSSAGASLDSDGRAMMDRQVSGGSRLMAGRGQSSGSSHASFQRPDAASEHLGDSGRLGLAGLTESPQSHASPGSMSHRKANFRSSEEMRTSFRFGMKASWPLSGVQSQMKAKLKERSNRACLGGEGRKPEKSLPPETNDLRSASIRGLDEKQSSAGDISRVQSNLTGMGDSEEDEDLEVAEDEDEDDRMSQMSEEEMLRTLKGRQLKAYIDKLPGNEKVGPQRERQHLQRIIQSADQLAPVRHSLQQLGIDELNRIVFQEQDPTKLLKSVRADIHTGLWSCCRRSHAHAPGCSTGAHTEERFICKFCGVICGLREPSKSECLYHPGTLQRSKAGGVWWSCCGAVGFQNSILHSAGGDINAPAEYRWGCKKSASHQPLELFDHRTDTRKYAQCTSGPVRSSKLVGVEAPMVDKMSDEVYMENTASVQCLRIASITVFGQPLMDVVLGIQLRFEDVIKGEIFDGPKRIGDPGPIKEGDHLRTLLSDTLELNPEEYITAMHGTVNDICYMDLSVVTNQGRVHKFFEDWKNETGEKSLRELYSDPMAGGQRHLRIEALPHERIVGFHYGIQSALTSIGILTRSRVFNDSDGQLKRCSLCADFFFDDENDEGSCRYHSGIWTPQRRVRVPDRSTMPKCGSLCDAKNCERRCTKFQHRSHVMTHSCGDTRCAEICSYEDCTRRCAHADHFHGTKDPQAAHDCGKPHPCHKLCSCGQRCQHISYKGEAIHTFHWCGSKEGCLHKCSVVGCYNQCSSSDHHHDLREDCLHICSDAHPCEEVCSASECDQTCKFDRAVEHVHQCNRAGELGCLCPCSTEGCGRRCMNDDHFHSLQSSVHSCGGMHPCDKKCSAKGCRLMCSQPRSLKHDFHRCQHADSIKCPDSCQVPMCPRQCCNPNHFHGLEKVKDKFGKLVPKDRHICDGFHLCPRRCRAPGCLSECCLDRGIEGHECVCANPTGCRHQCAIPGCQNLCADSDHFHKAEIHLCSNDHLCGHDCERKEPCVWEDSSVSTRKRQKKACGVYLAPGQTKHDGPHDCCGKHEPPVAFDADTDPTRCVQRCEKRGCRKRCQFGIERAEHTSSYLPPPADGHEAVHLCDQAMCLDLCPFPKCRRVCTLPHWHSVIDPSSRCGCTVEHRNYVPTDAATQAAQHAAETQEQQQQLSEYTRVQKLLAKRRVAQNIAEDRSRIAPSRPTFPPRLASRQPASKHLHKPAQREPQQHFERGEAGPKYGSHFLMYSGFAPLTLGEPTGNRPQSSAGVRADEGRGAAGRRRRGSEGALSMLRSSSGSGL